MIDETVAQNLVPVLESDGTLIDPSTGEIVSVDDTEIRVLALLESGWKSLATAASIQDISLLRDQASTAKRLLRKRHLSLESQNEAAKLHLAASLRMGDWLRNCHEKTHGARGIGSNQHQVVESQNETPPETYTSLGIDKRDASKMQRLWDWEQETQSASRAVEALKDKDMELVVGKLVDKANQHYKRKTRLKKIVEICAGNEALDTEQRYSVIYADPPWQYDHQATESRAIENQYPTMDIDAICKLPVSKLAGPDSVLFLWATSPKLEQGFQVIKAWGFEYVTCAIWDKEHIGQGYYFRQQHELLLVAKRGDIPPPEPAARPTWSIYSEQRTAHSAKPAKFAEVIEAMYPELPKIELFCRSPREGWAVWGNQSNAA